MEKMPYRSFTDWKKLHDDDRLDTFSKDRQGLLWLKTKSIVRKELMQKFLDQHTIDLAGSGMAEKFSELFGYLTKNDEQAHRWLDAFIRQEYALSSGVLDTKALESELYKLKYFDWGGDYKNALDRYLIDRYVKKYSSYDILTSKLDKEIQQAVHGYVTCSWYNHWSTILIENIFNQHPAVLPTVGQIKKVDFFIESIPFDLKMTYLPANFVENKRKQLGLKPELTELKQRAKQAGISYGISGSAGQTYHEISEKLRDRNTADSLAVLEDIRQVRLSILAEAQNNPRELITNLYEQQGEVRFDASNRLFLILVDSQDFDTSWKLKRNVSLLKPSINRYLDDFAHTKKLGDLATPFGYKGKTYTAYSDALFIVK